MAACSEIHLICVGTELLLGDTVNTNLVFLGRALSGVGLQLDHECCVPDEIDAIMAALESSLKTADTVIVIGGLGPTDDDITRAAASAFTGRELRPHPQLAERLRGLWRSANRPGAGEASFLRQADLLDGAEFLDNHWGTAPGIWCPLDGGKVLVLLPGPPREFENLVRHALLPRLQSMRAPTAVRSTVAVVGLPESQVELGVKEALSAFPDVSLGYCVEFGQVAVRLSTATGAEARLDSAEAAVRAHFGEHALAADRTLVDEVLDLARKRGGMLATAESCTGGGVAAAITDTAGASDIFAGSIICYSDQMKIEQLGVAPETIEQHGAVSAETAREMAAGLLARLQAGAGIAVTGIAGPDGGTEDKPVGLVFIATAVADDIEVQEHRLRGDRFNVRRRSVTTALCQLRTHLLRLAAAMS